VGPNAVIGKYLRGCTGREMPELQSTHIVELDRSERLGLRATIHASAQLTISIPFVAVQRWHFDCLD
jgi:hypothetical protein